MADNFTVWNRKKIYLCWHIFFVLLVGLMRFDWLLAPALGSFGVPGKWDPSLPAVHPASPGSALQHCLQHPACVCSAAADKCWIAAVWELLGSGTVRQGETQAGKMQAGGQVALWADRSCSCLPCQVWMTGVPLICLQGQGLCIPSALSATLSVCLQKRWGKAILFHTGLH